MANIFVILLPIIALLAPYVMAESIPKWIKYGEKCQVNDTANTFGRIPRNGPCVVCGRDEYFNKRLFECKPCGPGRTNCKDNIETRCFKFLYECADFTTTPDPIDEPANKTEISPAVKKENTTSPPHIEVTIPPTAQNKTTQPAADEKQVQITWPKDEKVPKPNSNQAEVNDKQKPGYKMKWTEIAGLTTLSFFIVLGTVLLVIEALRVF